ALQDPDTPLVTKVFILKDQIFRHDRLSKKPQLDYANQLEQLLPQLPDTPKHRSLRRVSTLALAVANLNGGEPQKAKQYFDTEDWQNPPALKKQADLISERIAKLP
ncbi:MAG: hypothetical protein AAF226_17030, partial [Verrucomicrobiota bacterium]